VIVVTLLGRLGNQMFQYAAGRSLAELHSAELVLDTSWMIHFRRGGGSERYELDCFDLDVRVCPVWEVARVPNPRRVVYWLQRLRPSRRPFLHVIAEDTSTNAFEPAVLSAPDDTFLARGYWQFEDYFVDHVPAIREAFTFPPLSPASEELADEIRATPAVSVHVRRGDYAGIGLLGFLDEAYYRRALETIAATVGELQLFVFSDDPAWCRENLRLPFPTTVVERPLPPERAWEDMRLISLCRHHVISNSTFSWWGVWLNPSPTKIVVGPKRWTQSPKRSGDPIPAGWIRV
jgi:Glycosyl transferase family 11